MLERYVLCPLSPAHQAEWETFVAGQNGGHLLQSWSWGELKTGANWRPLRLALREGDAGNIVAAASILRRTMLHLPPRLGHLAYVPKGPVLDWTASTENGSSLARLFLLRLRGFLRGRGALALQVEPALEKGTSAGQAAVDCLQALKFRETQPIQPLRTILLDIEPDEETLLAGMKEKWRYNVRLAARKGVEIRAASTLEEVQAWYNLLQTTGQRDLFGIHSLEYYCKAWTILEPRQQCRLLLAWSEGELLAGIFVSLQGHEAIYLYGASSNARRNLMPNYLLQWEAMRWARRAGATVYDFWGIPPTDESDEAMAGVYRFKSGWGGRVTTFIGNYEYDYHPLAMRVARSVLH